MSVEQYIYFPPITGIGNRMKKLFSALRFRVNWEEPLTLYWQFGKYMNYRFHDLFLFDMIRIEEKTCREISEISAGCDVSMGDDWRLWADHGELPTDFTRAFPKDDPGKEYIDFEFARIPIGVRDKYLKYFKELKPSYAVAERMKEVHPGSDYVGVHIRINDEWIDEKRGSSGDLEKFIRAMHEEQEEVTFFLATQSERISEQIKSEFGSRIYELPSKDYFDTVDAAADLYKLAGARKLIGTYGSTFSEVSWWLSGCSQEIRIIGSYEDWLKGKRTDEKNHNADDDQK